MKIQKVIYKEYRTSYDAAIKRFLQEELAEGDISTDNVKVEEYVKDKL